MRCNITFLISSIQKLKEYECLQTFFKENNKTQRSLETKQKIKLMNASKIVHIALPKCKSTDAKRNKSIKLYSVPTNNYFQITKIKRTKKMDLQQNYYNKCLT